MSEEEVKSGSAYGTIQFHSRLGIVVGAMCVVTLIALAFAVITALSFNFYLTRFPDVCDAVFEDFNDLTTVPEIQSISANGVINPLAGELRHIPGNDHIDPLFPITITFDPAKLPSYIGLTVDSVGRNGLKIDASDCVSNFPRSFFTGGPDVDEGPRVFLLAQQPRICSVDISQLFDLPGDDGVGITELVMAYPCTPSGKVANLPYEYRRDSEIQNMVLVACLTTLTVLVFVALLVYRYRKLKALRNDGYTGFTTTNILEFSPNTTVAKEEAFHAPKKPGFQMPSPTKSLASAFSKAKENYANRKQEKQRKKEEQDIAEAERKAEVNARKEAAKAQRRLLHQQHAEQQRQAKAQSQMAPPPVAKDKHYVKDDDIF